jgi:diadenosine tetraphosphate (Ap4A) HIT family hydrolase
VSQHAIAAGVAQANHKQVHFHLIPKPNQQEGLGVEWPTQKADMSELKKLLEDIKSKM